MLAKLREDFDKSVALNHKDMINLLVMLQLLHLNNYHIELQFNIPTVLEQLLAMRSGSAFEMDIDCRIQRVVAIFSLTHNFMQ